MSPDQTTTAESPEQMMIVQALEQGLKTSSLDIPVMPHVANKVFSLTHDPNAEVSDLSRLIHSDQSIAGHVLRIANSAAYGSGDPIVSLQQAVARLGMSLLGEISISVSIQSGLFKAPGFEMQTKALLKHALAAAAYGKEIARKRRRNVEGQFLCGLLHSVGKPIAFQLVANLCKERGIALQEAEVTAVVSRLHRTIASKVARDWKLPKQLQVTTVFYRQYESAPKFKDEAAATYLSAQLASWLLDSAGNDVEELKTDPVFAYLNLYPEDIGELLARKDDVLECVSAMEL